MFLWFLVLRDRLEVDSNVKFTRNSIKITINGSLGRSKASFIFEGVAHGGQQLTT